MKAGKTHGVAHRLENCLQGTKQFDVLHSKPNLEEGTDNSQFGVVFKITTTLVGRYSHNISFALQRTEGFSLLL